MIDREAVLTGEPSGSTLSATAATDPVFGFKTPEARATLTRAEIAEAPDSSWVDGRDRSERLLAFRGLSKEARAASLAHAFARTLEASANVTGGRRCLLRDTIGSLLGIELATWWRPTGANFFDRAPKQAIRAALEEVGGAAFAARYAGMKTAELSAEAERIFAGTAIIEAEVKERALAWVPEAMRFVPPGPEVISSDGAPPWEEHDADALVSVSVAADGEKAAPSPERSTPSDLEQAA